MYRFIRLIKFLILFFTYTTFLGDGQFFLALTPLSGKNCRPLEHSGVRIETKHCPGVGQRVQFLNTAYDPLPEDSKEKKAKILNKLCKLFCIFV